MIGGITTRILVIEIIRIITTNMATNKQRPEKMQKH